MVVSSSCSYFPDVCSSRLHSWPLHPSQDSFGFISVCLSACSSKHLSPQQASNLCTAQLLPWNQLKHELATIKPSRLGFWSTQVPPLILEELAGKCQSALQTSNMAQRQKSCNFETAAPGIILCCFSQTVGRRDKWYDKPTVPTPCTQLVTILGKYICWGYLVEDMMG